MQRNRDACFVSHINARELEAYVIDQLREISRNEVLVSRAIDEVNRLIREGVKPLLEDRDRIAARLKETQNKADRLVDALESGSVSIGRIEDRLGTLENEEKELQAQLEVTEFEIQNGENNSISAELVRQTYGNFGLVFDSLTASEKKRLIQLLIKRITYNKDIIRIDLYEFPHIGLDLGAHPDFLDKRLKWLSDPTTERTFFAAKHSFPIHLKYRGPAISISVGPAPVKTNNKGIASHDRLKAKKRHDEWRNPLKIAQHYRELPENSRTRSEIADIVGVSRPRVTQYMNLLNLPFEVQKYLSDSKHELDMTLFTERKLREIATIEDKEKQIQAFQELLM